MLTQGLKELHIISDGVSAGYLLLGYFSITIILITLGIVAYDWWIKKH